MPRGAADTEMALARGLVVFPRRLVFCVVFIFVDEVLGQVTLESRALAMQHAVMTFPCNKCEADTPTTSLLTYRDDFSPIFISQDLVTPLLVRAVRRAVFRVQGHGRVKATFFYETRNRTILLCVVGEKVRGSSQQLPAIMIPSKTQDL